MNTPSNREATTEQIIDAVVCLGVAFMNEGWVKFPHEREHMLAGFRNTKGYKQASEELERLLVNHTVEEFEKSRIVWQKYAPDFKLDPTPETLKRSWNGMIDHRIQELTNTSKEDKT